jgi:hypothetical protein
VIRHGLPAEASATEGKPDSSIRSDSKAGVKPGSAVKATGATAGQAARRVAPLPELSKANDIVDDLMSAPAVHSHPMAATPFPAPRKHYEEPGGFHLWIVVGIGLVGAAAIGGVAYALLWALDAIRM